MEIKNVLKVAKLLKHQLHHFHKRIVFRSTRRKLDLRTRLGISIYKNFDFAETIKFSEFSNVKNSYRINYYTHTCYK